MKISKAARRKGILNTGSKDRISNFLAQPILTRRQWNNIIKSAKRKKHTVNPEFYIQGRYS